MARRKAAPKTETADAGAGPMVRSFGDDLWSVVDLGNRFSQGMYIYGSSSALFKISVSSLCIDVLSQDVSKTPVELRRRVKGGSEVVQPNEHPVAALLERPSKFDGRRMFFRWLVTNLVIDSEYFVAVMRNGVGVPIEMQGIQKRQTNINASQATRRYVYRFGYGSEDEKMRYGWACEKPMFSNDVAHLVSRSRNGFDALSTGSLANPTIALLRQMQEYQTGLFNNGGMPVLAFKFPAALTPPQFERLKADFERAARAARESGKPFILEGAGGVVPDVEKISLSAVDTEFVKANSQAGLEAARYFRVPPHKVYLLESVKYDNQAEQERMYVDDALVPIFDVVEEGLQEVLLSEKDRADYFIRFDRSKAYAMNPEERRKIVETLWKNGMIQYDEMRAEIGHNAAGGDEGKVRMMSGNFVLVNEKNEVIISAGGNKPEDAGSGDEKTQEPAKKTAEPAKLRVVE